MNRLFTFCSAALPLVLASIASLAGCSDSPPAGVASPGIVRLDVLADAPEPRGREVVGVGRIVWPEDPSRIVAVGASATRVHDESVSDEPRLRVIVENGGTTAVPQISIRLLGKIEPGLFNKLVVSASSVHDCYVRCVIRNQGVPIIGSVNRGRIAPREADAPTSQAVLDLPSSRPDLPPADELELLFDSVRGSFSVGSIELCNQPIWAWLPDAEQGFGMVDLAGDARSSVGLSTERTLESELVVPRDARLSFSVGVPDSLRVAAAQQLVVEIHGKGSPQVHKLELQQPAAEAARWQEVLIPLERHAGRKVRIVYSLKIDGHKAGRGREAVCALSRPRTEIAKSAPKTVLLITSDTHRADHVGAAGLDATIRTPAIDALAARGVLFEDCWSSTNVTIPSHAAIMTAVSPRDIGVFDNFTRLSREARTLAEAFQDAGFLTYAVVSAPHLCDAASGLGQGFDRLNAPVRTNKRRSEQSIERVGEWTREAQGQDLFLWLHLFDAHTPYAPPEEFERMYWPADRDAYDAKLPEPQVPAPYRANLPAGVRDLGLLSARYRGEVSYLDRQLAELFSMPRIQDGVIALTADHGESLGEHGVYWEHAGLYPQTIHVPLVLAWPAAPAGTRVKEPVFQLDLAQTLLKLAGVVDPSLPGEDLLAQKKGPAPPRFTISSRAERASITKDGWHLIVSLRGHPVSVGAEQKMLARHHVELFDLTHDPACERDLAREELERAKDLRLNLCAWIAAAQPKDWGASDLASPEMAQHLAQLGYTAQSGATRLGTIDPDCNCVECAPFRVVR